MYSVAPVVRLVTQLSSFFTGGLHESRVVFMSLLATLGFCLCSLTVMGVLVFYRLCGLRDLFCSGVALGRTYRFSLTGL